MRCRRALCTRHRCFQFLMQNGGGNVFEKPVSGGSVGGSGEAFTFHTIISCCSFSIISFSFSIVSFIPCFPFPTCCCCCIHRRSDQRVGIWDVVLDVVHGENSLYVLGLRPVRILLGVRGSEPVRRRNRDPHLVRLRHRHRAPLVPSWVPDVCVRTRVLHIALQAVEAVPAEELLVVAVPAAVPVAESVIVADDGVLPPRYAEFTLPLPLNLRLRLRLLIPRLLLLPVPLLDMLPLLLLVLPLPPL